MDIQVTISDLSSLELIDSRTSKLLLPREFSKHTRLGDHVIRNRVPGLIVIASIVLPTYVADCTIGYPLEPR